MGLVDYRIQFMPPTKSPAEAGLTDYAYPHYIFVHNDSEAPLEFSVLRVFRTLAVLDDRLNGKLLPMANLLSLGQIVK